MFSRFKNREGFCYGPYLFVCLPSLEYLLLYLFLLPAYLRSLLDYGAASLPISGDQYVLALPLGKKCNPERRTALF